MSAIDLRVKLLVRLGRLYVLRLESGGRRVLLVLCNPLLGNRGVIDAAGTTAEGHMIGVSNRIPFDDRAVYKGVVNDGGIHIDHSGVIGKPAATPLAAGKADAEIASAVV